MKVDLRKSLFILPNLFTLSSVLCGYYAILTCASPEAQNQDFYSASLLIIFGMFFDTVDGRVARLTKTQSAVGVQLDSLADVISFGVAPAVLVYRWSLNALGTAGLLMCFGFLACGAIRLARFNVTTTGDSGAPKKPGKYIAGLPIPAAAGILISLVVATVKSNLLALGPYIIAAVVVALSFFMVSTIRFRSFKDLKLNARTIIFFVTALGTALFLAFQYHPSIALVWLLAAYVTIGVFETLIALTRRGRDDEEDAAELDEEFS